MESIDFLNFHGQTLADNDAASIFRLEYEALCVKHGMHFGFADYRDDPSHVLLVIYQKKETKQ